MFGYVRTVSLQLLADREGVEVKVPTDEDLVAMSLQPDIWESLGAWMRSSLDYVYVGDLLFEKLSELDKYAYPRKGLDSYTDGIRVFKLRGYGAILLPRKPRLV